MTSRWLAGDSFGEADKAALIELSGAYPDSNSHPHTFAWYAVARGFKV